MASSCLPRGMSAPSIVLPALRGASRLFLLACCALAASCGGGGGGGEEGAGQPLASSIAARVDGCADVRVHDSASVLYVTVEPGCTLDATETVHLRVGAGFHAIRIEQVGVEQAVRLPLGERQVTLVQRGSWRSFPNTQSWTWRDGAGLLAKDGGLYLLGGWNSDAGSTSEVWFTADLVNWTRRTAQAPWGGRHGAGWVVHGERLYVISGDYHTDVWSSPDGASWTRHTADGGFGQRYAPNAASLGGELLLYNGQDALSAGLTDVWASRDNGNTWGQVATVPYAGRALIHGAAVFRDRVYVIGGGLKGSVPTSTWVADTLAEYSDIWSSGDGRTWVKEASTLGFTPRTHFAVLGTAHGCYVANGSVTIQANLSEEVYFADDCVNFRLLPQQPPMLGVHATSLAEFNGSIVLLGGHGTRVGTTVWQYFPDGPAP